MITDPCYLNSPDNFYQDGDGHSVSDIKKSKGIAQDVNITESKSKQQKDTLKVLLFYKGMLFTRSFLIV